MGNLWASLKEPRPAPAAARKRKAVSAILQPVQVTRSEHASDVLPYKRRRLEPHDSTVAQPVLPPLPAARVGLTMLGTRLVPTVRRHDVF